MSIVSIWARIHLLRLADGQEKGVELELVDIDHKGVQFCFMYILRAYCVVFNYGCGCLLVISTFTIWLADNILVVYILVCSDITPVICTQVDYVFFYLSNLCVNLQVILLFVRFSFDCMVQIS